jgi:hypothetical protein
LIEIIFSLYVAPELPLLVRLFWSAWLFWKGVFTVSYCGLRLIEFDLRLTPYLVVGFRFG